MQALLKLNGKGVFYAHMLEPGDCFVLKCFQILLPRKTQTLKIVRFFWEQNRRLKIHIYLTKKDLPH
jgi:hypothetical protein